MTGFKVKSRTKHCYSLPDPQTAAGSHGASASATSDTFHMLPLQSRLRPLLDELNSDEKCSTNLYSIFMMLWYQHRKVPGRQDTILVADSRGAHVSKEPDVAKMVPSAANMALAAWNGYGGLMDSTYSFYIAK